MRYIIADDIYANNLSIISKLVYGNRLFVMEVLLLRSRQEIWPLILYLQHIYVLSHPIVRVVGYFYDRLVLNAERHGMFF